ncbi:MFS transporter [Staphylococcus agnetis]|uniref:MFS transporter n=1 Tax=Staphylococcus agnetis TaxID=985762 RepID=UPI000D03673C|nr:MFS transporter [Staphylococcus agnetis]MCO4339650.1 MFS transporter [Staphylococcus agnetis]MCO4341450.1 MFS transporter [Staphylococcus agnetis]MCO4344382.1 MFS transporter [Staphylococcus agnetis]MCO4350819.1 MFS transporter [Staphylococcus agnetis]MCO4353827.1 MFS transporter [Staphylococcus agnetis]
MNYNKIFNKSFMMLFVSNFFIFIAFEMLLPVLPAYLNQMQASPLQIGLIVSLFTIGSVLIRPFIGYYMINRNVKMIVILITAMLLIVTMSYPFLEIIVILMALRLFHGVLWGASTTVNNTLAIDYLPENKLGEGIGYFSISTTAGAIIAQSLGIFVYNAYTFNILIVCATALNLFALVMLTMLDTPKKAHVDVKGFKFLESLMLKATRFQSILVVLSTFSFGSIVTFLVIFSEQRHIPSVFLFFVINALVSTLIRPITGRWYDRKGPWSIIIFSAIIAFISMIVLAMTHTLPMLILSATLFGAGYGTLMPSLQTWAVQSVDHAKSSLANASFFSSFDLGFGMSSLLLSILSKWLSIQMIFFISSLAFLLVFILVIHNAYQCRRSHQ